MGIRYNFLNLPEQRSAKLKKNAALASRKRLIEIGLLQNWSKSTSTTPKKKPYLFLVSVSGYNVAVLCFITLCVLNAMLPPFEAVVAAAAWGNIIDCYTTKRASFKKSSNCFHISNV